MIGQLLFLSRCSIGIVFALSSIGKLRDLQAFVETIVKFRILPEKSAQTVAKIIVCMEVMIVVLLFVGDKLLSLGFLIAALLLIMFVCALISVKLRKIHTRCNCFGLSDKKVTYFDVSRNIIFLMFAGFGVKLAVDYPTQPIEFSGEYLLTGLIAIVLVVSVLVSGEIIELISSP